MPPQPSIRIYTDGAFSGKTKLAGIGVVFPECPTISFGAPFNLEHPTNQRAELLAIYRALLTCIRHEWQQHPVHIYSDSEYAIKCVTVWVATWNKNNWITTTGKPVLNQDLIKAILDLLPQFSVGVLFTHVYGHGKNKLPEHNRYNDEADKLAVLYTK